VVYATMLICIVFLPLMFLEGLEGRFFKPLAITYIVSILASLVVALTVTPAMCRLLLKPGDQRGRRRTRAPHQEAHVDGFLVRWLKKRYEPSLRWALDHRLVVISAALVATGSRSCSRGPSAPPSSQSSTKAPSPSSSPPRPAHRSPRATGPHRASRQRLMKVEGVQSVTRRTGRAERDEHAEPVSNSELDIVVAPKGNMAHIRREIASIATGVPGITVQVGQPIEHRLSHILSGTPAAIAINVYGEESLDAAIAREADRGGTQCSIPGARDVTANREVMITSLPIRYRHQDLAAAGLTPADAASRCRSRSTASRSPT
jgi:Cu/Ag efflux pump CusA